MKKLGTIGLLTANLLAFTASAETAQPSEFLQGFVTEFNCGEIDPYVLGDACIILIETSDKVQIKKGQVKVRTNSRIEITNRIAVITDHDYPFKGYDYDLPFSLLGEQVRISVEDLASVKKLDEIQMAREMVETPKRIVAQVLRLTPEAEIEKISPPRFGSLECRDKVRIAAMHAHQSAMNIVDETGMTVGKIEKLGSNTYLVPISDEVEGEKWEVRTDKHCNIKKVRNL